jgi:uncharacterized surface protein with fasciclin (FAS1) repeats
MTGSRLAASAALALLTAGPALAADLRDELRQRGGFETFLKALEASDAGWFLHEGDQRYTVFVPTDEAFAAMPEGVLEAMLKPENKPKLTMTLEHHVVPDVALSGAEVLARAEAGEPIDPAAGEPYAVSGSGGSVVLDGAQVVRPDIEAGPILAHAVSAVMVPEIVVEAMKYAGDWPE